MTIVVFDLDGTLVDSAPTIAAVASRVATELNLAPVSIAETISLVGKGADNFVRQMLAARGQTSDAAFADAVSRFKAHYATTPTGATQPMQNAIAALDRLANAGHVLGLCTNKPTRPTELELETLGWTNRFRSVICGDTLAVRKPDPEPLRLAIHELGNGAALFVGDSETDAATAEAANVPFLLYTKGYRKTPVADLPHTAAFDDFAELSQLVANHAS
ncbi:MAG: phosphoglycolate phosphatase [Pseudomonadota bacterium]